MTLIISSNEPDTIKYGLNWHEKPTITLLQTGDIMLVESAKVMLIERKAAADLLNSLADGRLVEQCSRLVDECHYPMLLTHGSLLCNKDQKVVVDGRVSMWGWWSLQMALVSIQAGGVMMMHTANVFDIPELVKHLQSWMSKDTHLKVTKREKIPFILPHKGMEVLAALPGIGLAKAQECLDYYGGAGRAIAELTCTEGCFLPKGVAGGTVRRVRGELGLQPYERLVVELGEEDGTQQG